MWFFKRKTIWERIKKKKKIGEFITVLAPMLDVTDKPFREIVSELGPPDLFFTEFVSVDGLCSKEGRKRLLKMFRKSIYEKKHHNLIFQIFGSDPEKFKCAVKIIKKLKPAGIDINTGCPDKAIIKQGSGSALMKTENWENMKLIYEITKKTAGNIPVSIKTRIGFSKIDWDWIRFILSLRPDAVTFHLRTTKEMSKVVAHWEIASKINNFRNSYASKTILLGNGDIKTIGDAEEKIKLSGFDGVMVGRGIFENPLLFSNRNWNEFNFEERKKILLRHIKSFHKEFYLGESKYLKSFALIKKFFKIYISGFDGAKELRTKLMESKSIKAVKEILK